MVTKSDVSTVKREFEVLSIKNAFTGAGALEYFLPKCYVQKNISDVDNFDMEEMSETYVFIHASKKEINEIKNNVPGLELTKPVNIKTNRKSHMILTEAEMRNLRLVSDVFKGMLPCFPMDSFNLGRCDLVRVHSGLFAGLEGLMVSRLGRNGGQVLLPINDLFMVASGEILPDDMYVLEFAKGSGHHLDQFDANMSLVTKALVSKLTTNTLDQESQDELSLFIKRYSFLRTHTINIQSTYSCLMLMSNVALGDKKEIERWRKVCNNVSPKLTDDHQIALHQAMIYAATGNPKYPSKIHKIIDGWGEISSKDFLKNRKKIVIDLLKQFEGLYASLKWLKS